MAQALWQPEKKSAEESHLWHFIQTANQKYQLKINDYATLYQWSIDYPELFWKTCAEFCELHFSTQPTKIMQSHAHMQKTKWFIDATLNFAAHLLSPALKAGMSDKIALRYANENGERAQISYAELSQQAHTLANKLESLGVKQGDRVAAFVTNRIETVIAMLASTLIGAVWSACGPEFGVDALIERFSQIEPVILFAVRAHDYHGKHFQHNETIAQLLKKIPSIKNVLYIDSILTSTHADTSTHTFSFDHPLYILYSSGTTGKPKCMVHGAGNTLIQHKKELMLHTDLHADDTIFFYTTCSWMMWHWMISSLSVGATVVLFDGSPTYPASAALFDLIDECDISIFGCGAKLFETYLKNNLFPKKTHRLEKLKTILTTGSPLIKESFEYIYRDVKQSVRLSSISGGSDIISCFALGNPLLPVYAEELQCRGLGMAVDIFDAEGKSIKNKEGELVCTKPFPSMPIYFWDDPQGEKYFNAYFNQFPNVWTHGDYAKLSEHDGIIIYGRSDATLNPGGIRIGTSDIYEQVLKTPEVLDCIAVGKQNNGDEEIILFVKLKNDLILDEKLILAIKKIIRDNTTPYHVPKKIVQVTDIPKTMNGKTMEIAVKNIINGRKVKNIEALANPECLAQFKNINT